MDKSKAYQEKSKSAQRDKDLNSVNYQGGKKRTPSEILRCERMKAGKARLDEIECDREVNWL